MKYNVLGKNGQFQVYDAQRITKIVPAQSPTWVASATLSNQLYREGIITGLRTHALMTATLTATAVADYARRAVDGISIVGDNKNYFGLTGGTQLGRMLALLNQADFQAAAQGQQADVGSTTFDMDYGIHFGSKPIEPFDFGQYPIGIPAQALANLNLNLNCPVAAATDPNGNITAGTYDFEIDEIQGIPIPANLMVPGAYTTVFTTGTAVTNYGQKFDVPTGAWVRRIILMTDDNTATTPKRTDATISAAQLEIPKWQNAIIMQQSWQNLKYATARHYGIVGSNGDGVLGALATTRTLPGSFGDLISANMPLGFAIIDLRDYFNPVLGMNLIQDPTSGYTYQQGDVKLDFTLAATAGTLYILWDVLYPVDPQLVGHM